MVRRSSIVRALGLVVGLSSCSSGGGNGAGVDGGTGANGSASQSPTGPKCVATASELVDLRSLATQVGAPFIAAAHLTVDAASVYFVFDNTLMSVPIRGGSVTTMFPLSTDQRLALGNRSSQTVGCDACDGSLLRVPAAGGPSVALGSGTYAAVDDSCLYWSTSAGIFSAKK